MYETDRFAFATARERLAGLLMNLVTKYGEQTSDGPRIVLRLKREELAQMVALSIETVIRLLQALHADQIIRLHGRNIIVLQPDYLAHVAKLTASASDKESRDT